MIDAIALVVGVVLVNYVSIDGRANYFEGSSFVLLYLTLVGAFFFWVRRAAVGGARVV